MSIRLRRVPGIGLVALCAARSVPKEGDVYLDDEQHQALNVKFHEDHRSEGRCTPEWDRVIYPDMVAAMEAEESNNPNRDWWDRTYGRAPCPEIRANPQADGDPVREMRMFSEALAEMTAFLNGIARDPPTTEESVAAAVIELKRLTANCAIRRPPT